MSIQAFLHSHRSKFIACQLAFFSGFWGCSEPSPACSQESAPTTDLVVDSAATNELSQDVASHCTGNTLEIVNRERPGRSYLGGVQGTLSIKSPCLAIEGDNYLTLAGDPRGWIILESGSNSWEFLSLIEMYLLNSTEDLSKLDFNWTKPIEHLLPNVAGSEMLIRYGCLDSTHSTLPRSHRVELRWLIVPPVGDLVMRAEFQYSCE